MNNTDTAEWLRLVILSYTNIYMQIKWEVDIPVGWVIN